MPSLFDMPPLGTNFNPNNGLLGFGDSRLNDKLGGTNSGLLRTITQLSGMDVVNALQNQLAANPQSIMVLTGTSGNTVQAPGTIGVSPGSNSLTSGISSPINAGGSGPRQIARQ